MGKDIPPLISPGELERKALNFIFVGAIIAINYFQVVPTYGGWVIV